MATQPVEAPEVTGTTDAVTDPPARDWEAEARGQGWTDKEEFQGDPAKWIDAESFVKRGETILPFMKKQNDHFKREIDQLKGMVKRLTKAEQSAYDNALAKVRQEMREAVKTGDPDAYEAAEKQYDELQKNGEKTTIDRPDPRPAFNAFREANEWYDLGGMASASAEERRARVKADQIADRLVSDGYADNHTPEEFFEKVAEEVLSAIPTLGTGEKPPRTKPNSDVAGVTRPGSARNARTGANLPAEAKQHAERYKQLGIYKVKTNQEAYDLFAKSFDWDDWQKRNG